MSCPPRSHASRHAVSNWPEFTGQRWAGIRLASGAEEMPSGETFMAPLLNHEISARPAGEGEGVRAKLVTHFYEASNRSISPPADTSRRGRAGSTDRAPARGPSARRRAPSPADTAGAWRLFRQTPSVAPWRI